MKRSLIGLLVLGLWLMDGAAAAHAQSALDGFDPNVNDIVRTVALQPDGKILIGGDFTMVGGVTRNHIARVNPDGTLDPIFNPDAGCCQVYAIALRADGKVLAGGNFTQIGEQPLAALALLDATTGAPDLSFQPNPNNTVDTIVVQPDGQILIGGSFGNVDGVTRGGIARLNPDGSLELAFDPSAGGRVRSIILQSTGQILMAGDFTSVNGQTRNYIARLNANGTLDTVFNPNADDGVYAIAVQADGKILAGGHFTNIGGQPRNEVARLDAASGAADAFDPNPGINHNIVSLAVQPDGKILVGGDFSHIGGQSRFYLARLDAATGMADSFNGNVSSPVYSFALQPDGKLIIGGSFVTVADVTRNRVARLEADGSIDRTADLNVTGSFVKTTAVQPDGRFLIGGSFNSVLGVPRNNVARLNTDGTLDMNFNPDADGVVNAIVVESDGKILVGGSFTNIGGQARSGIARLDAASGSADALDPFAIMGPVDSVALQTDGKILVGGSFSEIGGQTRHGIARLDPVSGLADSFDPNANGPVKAMVVQTDGKILVVGAFTNIGGQARSSIARLDPASGSTDSYAVNGIMGPVDSVALQSDGKVLVGGGFTHIGGQPRNGIARLDPGTGLPDLFDANSNGAVNSIAVQSDGKILVGGAFTNIGGQPRSGIARLDAVTAMADSYAPNALMGPVDSVGVQSDGKILVGGGFTEIGGQPRNLFARLSNDTTASQGLTATKTSINWTRDGASPQVARVVFEQSTDGVNYTLLGHGTGGVAPRQNTKARHQPYATTSNTWMLTGLNLPANQNVYLRARGVYLNGSESITESVRNAFFVAPTASFGGISGRIVDVSGAPLAGASINLSGFHNRKTITNTNGAFHFNNIETNRFYTVTPSLANYNFSPASRSFSQLGSNTEVAFAGSRSAGPSGGGPINPLDVPEYFVRQQYVDLLGREPDESGFNYWSDQILACGADAVCVNARRRDVAAAFFIEQEFQESGSFIYNVYQSALSRRPVFMEYASDRQQVVGGAHLDAEKTAFAESFAQRPEFVQRYQASTTAESFIDALLQNVQQSSGVDLSSERDSLLNRYDSGANQPESRALVLRDVTDNAALRQAEYNRAFVLTEYFGYLRRDPDAGGYAFWLEVLNRRAAGNYHSMVCAFITSTEYQLRFSSVVTHSNGECGN